MSQLRTVNGCLYYGGIQLLLDTDQGLTPIAWPLERGFRLTDIRECMADDIQIPQEVALGELILPDGRLVP